MTKKAVEKILIALAISAAALGGSYALFFHTGFPKEALKAVKSFRDDKFFAESSQTIEIKNNGNDQGDPREMPPDQAEKQDINDLEVKEAEELQQIVDVPQEDEENKTEEVELPNAEEENSDEKEDAGEETALPPAKKNLTDDLRIGFMTDIHADSTVVGTARILKEDYQKEIDYFISQMNNEFGPDFIITGGDLIEGTKVPADQGMHELGLVKSAFGKTAIPSYHTIGNHDLRSVSKSQWKQIFGYINTSFVFGDYKIIIVDSNYDSDDKNIRPGLYYTRGNVAQEQVRWLKAQLRDTDKKTIVFIHHPPLRDIDSRNNDGLLKNAEELQGLFEKYKTVAVFSGHIEDLYYNKNNGVKYYVIPGTTKHPKYSGSFAEIRINGGSADVSLNYISGAGYKKIKVD